MDNSGLWHEVDFESNGIEYFIPGEAHWMDNAAARVDAPVTPVGD